ncbi:MAG: TetR/AcrR family transcriptional regulator [Deltaproteobacteria bacterium]|nr:TetR/AcrR family transcriptional regulator [Deltaproteobacteria bacterium]
MATRRRGRRTQAERTAAMRERLLEATVECLVELGYTGTTTTAVVKRAGVSRGAILHHFPTKQDLVSTAVEYVLDRRNAAFVQRFASSLPPRRDERFVEALMQALWTEVDGPLFYAWLELVVASRTDPELRTRVGKIAERWTETTDLGFREIFGLPRQPGRHPHALAPIFSFMVLNGLALEKLARPHASDVEKRVLRALKTMAPLATIAKLAD